MLRERDRSDQIRDSDLLAAHTVCLVFLRHLGFKPSGQEFCNPPLLWVVSSKQSTNLDVFEPTMLLGSKLVSVHASLITSFC